MLFRRAWEVAEAVEQSGTSSILPGRRPSGRTTQGRASLRREILQIASKRDYRLGEEFLAKLTPKDTYEAKIETASLSSAEISERLRLANQFLAAGDDVSRALHFADPALSRVTQGSVEFLVRLRDKDAVAANQRFTKLLL